MNARILLVEDEADLALIVADTLRAQGYEVATAADGIDALERYSRDGADIVVADVMMPRMDGFAMARAMRRRSPDVPLLLLTARSTVDDVEQGFEAGASDYLKKPFELRELLVRIKALLRRSGREPHAAAAPTYAIGAYTFDVAAQTLSTAGEAVELTYFEARILELLAAGMGTTVEAAALMKAVWGRDDPPQRNSLHGYVHRLRRALRHDPAVRLVNQRGVGYMLAVRLPRQ